jgi:hypothetical protein
MSRPKYYIPFLSFEASLTSSSPDFCLKLLSSATCYSVTRGVWYCFDIINCASSEICLFTFTELKVKLSFIFSIDMLRFFNELARFLIWNWDCCSDNFYCEAFFANFTYLSNNCSFSYDNFWLMSELTTLLFVCDYIFDWKRRRETDLYMFAFWEFILISYFIIISYTT